MSITILDAKVGAIVITKFGHIGTIIDIGYSEFHGGHFITIIFEDGDKVPYSDLKVLTLMSEAEIMQREYEKIEKEEKEKEDEEYRKGFLKRKEEEREKNERIREYIEANTVVYHTQRMWHKGDGGCFDD